MIGNITSLFRRKYRYIRPNKLKVVKVVSCEDCRYCKRMKWHDMKGTFCIRAKTKKETKVLELVGFPYFPIYADHEICRNFENK
jgi:thioredoxin-related protein